MFFENLASYRFEILFWDSTSQAWIILKSSKNDFSFHFHFVNWHSLKNNVKYVGKKFSFHPTTGKFHSFWTVLEDAIEGKNYFRRLENC